MSKLFYLSWSAVVTIWLLVVFGGIVRVTGSGMGCGPDWPLCNGQLVPVFSFETFIEFFHRIAAAVGSVLIVWTIAVALRSPDRNRWVSWPAVAAGAALVVQILLGAVTVFLDLAAPVVMVHLGVAAILLALLTVVAAVALRRAGTPWAAGPARRATRPASLTRLAAATAVCTFAVIMIGAYMMGVGASLGCLEFPTCNTGSLLPGESVPAQIHTWHRAAALLAGLLLTATGVRAWHYRQIDPLVARLGLLAGVLYGIQVLVGVANVFFYLPGALRVAHLGLAFALWAAVVALWVCSQASATLPLTTRTATARHPSAYRPAAG
ncbi:MAG: heme A synthase [Chloroflexi bacterium]|nr:heme A synthase [Chloroflexota bacterium]